MTIKEYMVSLLPGLTIPEAFFEDMTLDVEEDYEPSMYNEVGIALVNAVAGVILAPQVKSVNENGFSMSWDTDLLGKYYLWLCKRYGITPDPDVTLGLGSIIDKSDIW